MKIEEIRLGVRCQGLGMNGGKEKGERRREKGCHWSFDVRYSSFSIHYSTINRMPTGRWSEM
jgi:hypothetical protein